MLIPDDIYVIFAFLTAIVLWSEFCVNKEHIHVYPCVNVCECWNFPLLSTYKEYNIVHAVKEIMKLN